MIKKKFERILFMILDLYSIYTEYSDQNNKTNKKYDKILTYALELKQVLYTNNE